MKAAPVSLAASEVHPSHPMFDEGWLYTDPRCAVCRLEAYDVPESIAVRLRAPCEGPPVHRSDDERLTG